MGDEYLATGFVDVDQSDNPSDCHNCLSLLDLLPYYRKIKRRSYDLLGLVPGLYLLDVGCGIGDDALRMAKRLAPGGRVVGVDPSARMIEAAAARVPTGLPLEFLRADARNLPFEEAVFARCRVDRTLQHIERPETAVAEMVRVLTPEGLLLAYDNDWETFSVSGPDPETSAIIEQYWMNSFVNPRIGRELERLFADAGLVDLRVFPSESVLYDFEIADRVYNLRLTARRTAAQGLVSGEKVLAWLSEAQTRNDVSGFRCSLTAFTVVGRKPSR